MLSPFWKSIETKGNIAQIVQFFKVCHLYLFIKVAAQFAGGIGANFLLRAMKEIFIPLCNKILFEEVLEPEENDLINSFAASLSRREITENEIEFFAILFVVPGFITVNKKRSGRVIFLPRSGGGD
jgi:hypothetical protein